MKSKVGLSILLILFIVFCCKEASHEEKLIDNTVPAKKVDTYFYASGKKHLLSYYIPKNYDASKKYPLVVGLHYCTGDAKSYRNSLIPLADSLNYIILCPDNTGLEILDTQLGIVTVAIDSAKSAYNIDTDSMYLTGMSCNGGFTLRQGLRKFYPFRGIFPWDPWVPSRVFTQYKLDSDMPIVLAVGTNDDNFAILMSLFDSLKNHGSNINLVLVPGVGHTSNFNEFGNTMVQCIRYLNTPKTISIQTLSDITMTDTDDARHVEVNISTTGDKELQVKLIHKTTTVIEKPVVTYTPESNKVEFNITPRVGNYGSVKLVVEVSEKDGLALAQLVCNVTVNRASTIR